jgi:hypothetical protein
MRGYGTAKTDTNGADTLLSHLNLNLCFRVASFPVDFPIVRYRYVQNMLLHSAGETSNL